MRITNLPLLPSPFSLLPSPVSRFTSHVTFDTNPIGRLQMAVDYIRHAARLARQLVQDAGPGGTPVPDAEFYRTLAKAMEQAADAIEQAAKRRD